MRTKIAVVCVNCGQPQWYQQHSPEIELVQAVLRSPQAPGSLCMLLWGNRKHLFLHPLVLLICSGSFLVLFFNRLHVWEKRTQVSWHNSHNFTQVAARKNVCSQINALFQVNIVRRRIYMWPLHFISVFICSLVRCTKHLGLSRTGMRRNVTSLGLFTHSRSRKISIMLHLHGTQEP